MTPDTCAAALDTLRTAPPPTAAGIPPLLLRFHPETLALGIDPWPDDRRQQVLLRRWASFTPEQRWASLNPGDAERLRTFIAQSHDQPAHQVPDCVVRLRVSGIELPLRLNAWPDKTTSCATCRVARLCYEPTWATAQPEIEQLAHDLRGGLQNLLSLAQLAPMVSQAIRNPLVADWAAALRASVSYVSVLADTLELSARVRSASSPIQRSLQVCQLLREVYDYFRPQAKAKGIELKVSCCARVEAEVMQVDAPVLRRVLHNLVGNALKYIRTGEVVVEAVLVEPNRLEVRVRDTGPGLDPRQQKLAFRPYVRLSTSRGTEGSGLGLAIVRQIVEQAGGEVQLFSRLGEGTELVVNLPVRPA